MRLLSWGCRLSRRVGPAVGSSLLQQQPMRLVLTCLMAVPSARPYASLALSLAVPIQYCCVGSTPLRRKYLGRGGVRVSG